jgi:hypothetical protein
MVGRARFAPAGLTRPPTCSPHQPRAAPIPWSCFLVTRETLQRWRRRLVVAARTTRFGSWTAACGGERPIPCRIAARPVAVTRRFCLPATVSRQRIPCHIPRKDHPCQGVVPSQPPSSPWPKLRQPSQASLARPTRRSYDWIPARLGHELGGDRPQSAVIVAMTASRNADAQSTPYEVACDAAIRLPQGTTPANVPAANRERGGRSSWRLGTATTTPIVGVSRRRPLLVPPRSRELYPAVRVTNLTASSRVHFDPKAHHRERWSPYEAALVVVGGLVGCWGVAG